MLFLGTGHVLKNRYELRQRLGTGGMGMVFAAHDQRLGRSVAVKFIRPEYLSEPTAMEAFRREAHTIAQLSHPHILTVFDMDEEEDGEENIPYLVMEYAAGGTLAQRLAVGPFTVVDARRIFGEIGAALDYAHTRSVIHLDLKPANILFNERDQTRVSDFGLARLLEGVSRIKVDTGVGSGPYMPHEQSLGGDAGSFSDIYALGIVLYEVLAGVRPRRIWNNGALIVQIEHPLPPGLADVILQATRPDPAARFATIGEMLEAWDSAGSIPQTRTPSAAPARTETTSTTKQRIVGGRAGRAIDPISQAIQERLAKMGKATAPATEVARWLDQMGVLRDNPANRGKPLRDLLRAGRIAGRRQDDQGRWFIDLVPDDPAT